MGKQKRSKKDRAGRKRYRNELRREVNKDSRMAKHAKKVKFYELRNEVREKTGLDKASAKKVARMVTREDLEIDEAVSKLGFDVLRNENSSR